LYSCERVIYELMRYTMMRFRDWDEQFTADKDENHCTAFLLKR